MAPSADTAEPQLRRTGKDYPRLGRLTLAVALMVAVLLALALVLDLPGWTWGELLPWGMLVLAADLLPIRPGNRFAVDLDLPVLLAAGFVLGPVPAAIASLFAIDPAEVRARLPLIVVVFNRLQKMAAVLGASLVFWILFPALADWPWILAAAFVALVVDVALNLGAVAVAGRVVRGVPLRESLMGLLADAPRIMLLTYGTFGISGLVLAQLYRSVGGWALAVFPAPLLMARLALSGIHDLRDASEVIEQREESLRRVPDELVRERADERLAIAAALHDDLIQSLHFLTLHAHVIREDLRGGNLLHLDEDVPALLRVSQDAADVARELVNGLRHSPLGAAGLESTLNALCDRLRDDFLGSLCLSVDDVTGCSDGSLLLAYQIAREAATNAIKHAQASRIDVEVRRRGDVLVVEVRDDGHGFEAAEVDQARHFGLQLMRERAQICGGGMSVTAVPGRGTTVLAELPVQMPAERASEDTGTD